MEEQLWLGRFWPFIKIFSWADFDILESNSIYIFVHENKKIPLNIFSLDACSASMWRVILISEAACLQMFTNWGSTNLVAVQFSGNNCLPTGGYKTKQNKTIQYKTIHFSENIFPPIEGSKYKKIMKNIKQKFSKNIKNRISPLWAVIRLSVFPIPDEFVSKCYSSSTSKTIFLRKCFCSSSINIKM